MNQTEFENNYIQTPRFLKIGDFVRLKNPRGISIEPADTKTYEVIEFLDKGDIKIKEAFSDRLRIVDSGRIAEIAWQD